MKNGKRISAVLSLSMILGLFTSGIHASSTRIEEMLAGMTTRQKITQMIMPDFRQWKSEGQSAVTDMTVLNEEVAQIIDQYDFGGVILFANNVKETEQTRKLTHDLQNAAVSNKVGNGKLPLLLGIDQEGGIVFRLGSGTALPGNMAIGATRDIKSAEAAGQVIGRELNALGLNVNFAPVLDTNNNPNNPVIGLRSISSRPELVAQLGIPMLKGMQKYNIAAAAKHFPGHGDTATDSHYGLPVVNKSLTELENLELVPFQAAVDNGVDMLMTAHIQYPQIEKDTVISKKDGSNIYLPATLSDDIITGIIRDKMNFNGVVITDAMGMEAISANFGEAEAVVMAMKADVDICLMPTVLRTKNDLKKMDHIIDTVEAAIAKGELDMKTLDDSVERILTLKEKRGILDYESDIRTWNEKLAFANAQVGSKENRKIERDIAAQAVTVVKNEGNILPLNPKANDKVLLISAWPNEQPGMELGMRRLMNDGVISKDVKYESLNYCILSGYGGSSLDVIKSKIDSSKYVIVSSEISNAAAMNPLPTGSWQSYYPTEIIRYANRKNVAAVHMSVEKPYELGNFPDAFAQVAVYGWKGMDPTEEIEIKKAIGPNIPAGIEVIFGGYDATGTLPVDVPLIQNAQITDTILYPFGFGLSYEDPSSGMSVELPKEAETGSEFIASILLGDLTSLSEDAYKIIVQVNQEAAAPLEGKDYVINGSTVTFDIDRSNQTLLLKLKAVGENKAARPVSKISVVDTKGREFLLDEASYPTMNIFKRDAQTPIDPIDPIQPESPVNPINPNTSDSSQINAYGLMILFCVITGSLLIGIKTLSEKKHHNETHK